MESKTPNPEPEAERIVSKSQLRRLEVQAPERLVEECWRLREENACLRLENAEHLALCAEDAKTIERLREAMVAIRDRSRDSLGIRKCSECGFTTLSRHGIECTKPDEINHESVHGAWVIAAQERDELQAELAALKEAHSDCSAMYETARETRAELLVLKKTIEDAPVLNLRFSPSTPDMIYADSGAQLSGHTHTCRAVDIREISK